MNVQVNYTNALYGEFEEYSSTLSEIVDSFNGENVFLNLGDTKNGITEWVMSDELELTEELLLNILQSKGIADIQNGYAWTTLKEVKK